jgi:hypothetical protein
LRVKYGLGRPNGQMVLLAKTSREHSSAAEVPETKGSVGAIVHESSDEYHLYRV